MAQGLEGGGEVSAPHAQGPAWNLGQPGRDGYKYPHFSSSSVQLFSPPARMLSVAQREGEHSLDVGLEPSYLRADKLQGSQPPSRDAINLCINRLKLHRIGSTQHRFNLAAVRVHLGLMGTAMGLP